ncbi:MAG: site-2 protease family protein, partial [Candidatus Aenigmatarchaeota archaeon]
MIIDPYILAFVLIFFLGLGILWKLNFRRHFIFFLLETNRGLKFVDKISRFSPSIWKFLSDMAITVSFGGFGSYYVAHYRNPWLINFILGLVCLIFVYISNGFLFASLGLLILIICVFLNRRYEKPLLHLITTTIIMCFLMLYIFPFFSTIEILKLFVSIFFGMFGIPALLISLMFSQAFKILMGLTKIPGVSPLLPTATSEGFGFFFPGTGIFIPFWQAVIAIVCLLVPHEFAHGLLTRVHKIPLKSAGVLTAGPIPLGAFVEPDEKILKMRKSKEKMRIYAVGSFANIIVALIAFLTLLFVLGPIVNAITEPKGIIILNVLENSPAYGVLEKGYVIKEINGMPTRNLKEFNDTISKLKPNQTVEIVTYNGTFELKLGARSDNPERAYIGVDLQESYEVRSEFKEKYPFYVDAIFFITPTF